MKERRILLVGDGNHQAVINYASWLNKQDIVTVSKKDILSITPVEKKNSTGYDTVFEVDPKNFLLRRGLKTSFIRILVRRFLYKELIRKLPEYDFVHFHFVSPSSDFIIEQIQKTASPKIILTIWGSDLYRVTANEEPGFIKSCQKADYITFGNEITLDFFKKKYDWKKDNLKITRFGVIPLEHLIRLEKSKIECKAKLQWSMDKLAITIGYNLSRAQRHLEILSQFDNEMISGFKDRIQLIIPITYGGDKKYRHQIMAKLNRMPFEYVIYDSVLKPDMIADIRKASDIMIHLQTTDQFSGSMLEHLFSRNVVITGSWLPYGSLKEKGVWFIEIDKIPELSSVLTTVINEYEQYAQKTINATKVIPGLALWEKNIKDWVSLYN
jgi:hypothetical protein